MRAVVLRRGELLVDEVPEPVCGPGQLLVEPVAVGVCGSDLSAWQHTEQFLQASLDSGTDMYVFDPDRDLVMGHEFTARVIQTGDGVVDFVVGDTIVATPAVTDPKGRTHVVGYSTDYPGALAERVVVQATPRHIKIPAGVSPLLTVLTEPVADGFQAVARTRIAPPSGGVVIGCGPLGLGAVACLAERGVSPIVASDPSAVRRALAASWGAHATVDPAEAEPVATWQGLAEPGQRLFVFDFSGVKGMLNRLLYAVPPNTRITIVGSVMVDDTIRPVVGVYKNIKIEFWGGADDPDLGPTAEDEYRKTFDRIAEGRIDAASLVTGYTGLEGTPALFGLLRPGNPEKIEHIKVIIRPDLTESRILPFSS